VVGLAAGMAVNMSLVKLNAYTLFPMPEGTSMSNPEQMNAWVATLPTAAFFVVIAAHLGQSFVGGWVAARLGSSRPMLLAMIVGFASLAGGIMIMMSIKGPTWLMIELPLYLVVAWLAGRMEVNRRLAAGN
jgi:MFS family permease